MEAEDVLLLRGRADGEGVPLVLGDTRDTDKYPVAGRELEVARTTDRELRHSSKGKEEKIYKKSLLRSRADGEGVPLGLGNTRDTDKDPVAGRELEVARTTDRELRHSKKILKKFKKVEIQ